MLDDWWLIMIRIITRCSKFEFRTFPNCRYLWDTVWVYFLDIIFQMMDHCKPAEAPEMISGGSGDLRLRRLSGAKGFPEDLEQSHHMATAFGVLVGWGNRSWLGFSGNPSPDWTLVRKYMIYSSVMFGHYHHPFQEYKDGWNIYGIVIIGLSCMILVGTYHTTPCRFCNQQQKWTHVHAW